MQLPRLIVALSGCLALAATTPAFCPAGPGRALARRSRRSTNASGRPAAAAWRLAAAAAPVSKARRKFTDHLDRCSAFTERDVAWLDNKWATLVLGLQVRVLRCFCYYYARLLLLCCCCRCCCSSRGGYHSRPRYFPLTTTYSAHY